MSEQDAAAFGQLGSPDPTAMVSVDGDSICEMCRKIDFHDLLQNPQQGAPWGELKPSPYTMRYSNGCKLCSLMFQHVPSMNMKKIFELRSYSLKKLSIWADKTYLDAQDSISLKIHLKRPYSSSYYPLNDVFCKTASDKSQGLNCAQPVQETWDTAKARSWLNTCTKHHKSVCEQYLLPVPDMNLIDCEEMVIVEAAKEMRWLALSYVWGLNLQVEDHVGYRAGSIIPLGTPRTIRDAIGVTLKLGHRYLWVDEYCIDQKDDNHRNDQIKSMDQIYRGADLTIVAAAGDSKSYGLPGVSSTRRKDKTVIRLQDVVVFSNGPDPRHEIEESKWFTRAW